MQDDAAEMPAPSTLRARLLVPAAMLLAGLGLGGAGAWFLAAPTAPAAEHGEATAEGAPAEDGAAPTEGHGAAPGEGAVEGHALATGLAVTSLGTFTVNLRGTGGGRLLRLEVQVEGPALQSDALASRAAPIRDTIITAVSDYTWSELEGSSGKIRLRDELMARVNSAASPSSIERIYFTQFVVQ
ncbi:MAG: flagellar basal body-associated FliL family protein [Pseudomonadota bacterium]|nr:flagellar basal body-associated FliL family protein [Pseudomonadota bacterium]